VQVKDGDDTLVVEAAKGKKKEAADGEANDDAPPAEDTATDAAAADEREPSPDARTAVEKAVEEAGQGDRR
jgi:hypothetical protein